MARPSNLDIFNRTPELEAGSESAVATVQAQYTDWKVIEAEVDETTGNAEVTIGRQLSADVAQILDVFVENGAIVSTEERPNVPPGHRDHRKDKLDHSLKHRKPKAKLKQENHVHART